MTRWKLDPWYPKPFSPVHSARKFSIVDNQMRSQSSTHPVIQSSSRVESIIDRVDRRPIAPRHAPAVLGTTSARSYDREKTPSSSYRQSSLKARPRITRHHRSKGMESRRRSLDDLSTPIDPSTTHRHLDAPGGLTTDLDVEVAHGVGHGRRRCVRARKCRRIDPSIDDRRSSPVGDYFFGGEKAGLRDGTRGRAEGPGDAVKA
jgi:hypothetical protein